MVAQTSPAAEPTDQLQVQAKPHVAGLPENEQSLSDIPRPCA